MGSGPEIAGNIPDAGLQPPARDRRHAFNPPVTMAGMSKRSRPPAPSESDRQLFQDAVGPVRRLRAPAQVSERPRPPPIPHQSRADEARVTDELLAHAFDPASMEIGEELLYLKQGHSPRILKRLRRGHYAVADELDLHQMNAAAASASLKRFLDECRQSGRLCVKVIHGKGLRSRAGGPVLKRLADRLLRQRGDVIAFAPAQPAQGGTGATLVLLAR
jgi:DNA-nicking Smr family endonuclease